MSKVIRCRRDDKSTSLPLFDWADQMERCSRRVNYPARWLCRRFPELDPCIAQLIALHAGMGARDE